MSDLYHMELHEQRTLDEQLATTVITRVPGGWIYTFYNQVDEPSQERTSSVFVPFDNEFQPR